MNKLADIDQAAKDAAMYGHAAHEAGLTTPALVDADNPLGRENGSTGVSRGAGANDSDGIREGEGTR